MEEDLSTTESYLHFDTISHVIRPCSLLLNTICYLLISVSHILIFDKNLLVHLEAAVVDIDLVTPINPLYLVSTISSTIKKLIKQAMRKNPHVILSMLNVSLNSCRYWLTHPAMSLFQCWNVNFGLQWTEGKQVSLEAGQLHLVWFCSLICWLFTVSLSANWSVRTGHYSLQTMLQARINNFFHLAVILQWACSKVVVWGNVCKLSCK